MNQNLLSCPLRRAVAPLAGISVAMALLPSIALAQQPGARARISEPFTATGDPEDVKKATRLNLNKSQFAFVAINVVNLDKMLSFYNLLGMTEARREDRPSSLTVNLRLPDDPGADVGKLTLVWHKQNEGNPIPNHVVSRIAFFVPNVDSLAEKLRAAGYAAPAPRPRIANGFYRTVWTRDPEGNYVELIELY